MTDYYIGLMSGTSLDGVDAVLAAFSDDGACTVQADHAVAYPAEVRAEVLALQPAGHDELARAARLGNRLADLYAEAVAGVLAAAGLGAGAVRAIGCHGQTIRHAPDAGYTLQIGNLARLAELTGIDVAGDFRSRDVAAGGQGAPLVPAFHDAVFGRAGSARVIVNIGGIANLTLLLPSAPVSGFDCGPGNMLMDAWCRLHQGQPYDRDGAWATGGRVLPELLARLAAEPFFAAPPPKSTGRDLFDLGWLQQRLAGLASAAPADVQATLLELTVVGIAEAIERHAPAAGEIYLCGGGALNRALRARLAERLAPRRIDTTATLGLPVLQVEAAAFAWLARQLVERQPGNLPEATGARGLRVLGALYPR